MPARKIRRRLRVTLSSEPLPELDVVAVRVADLGAGVLLPDLWSPRRLDALRREMVECTLHVLDLERHHPVTEVLAARRRFGTRLRIAHQLDRGPAEVEIDEIERSERRDRNAVTRADLESEHVGIEPDRLLRPAGEELDVVD